MDIGFDRQYQETVQRRQELQAAAADSAQSLATAKAVIGVGATLAVLGLVLYLFVAAVIGWVGGSGSAQFDGDTRGECVTAGGTWVQTGSNPVLDGVCR